jgi:hypothetical protein
MLSSFSRSARSFDADSPRRLSFALLLAAVLLTVWVAWFFLARVAVYEVTDKADLEVRSFAASVVLREVARIGASIIGKKFGRGGSGFAPRKCLSSLPSYPLLETADDRFGKKISIGNISPRSTRPQPPKESRPGRNFEPSAVPVISSRSQLRNQSIKN